MVKKRGVALICLCTCFLLFFSYVSAGEGKISEKAAMFQPEGKIDPKVQLAIERLINEKDLADYEKIVDIKISVFKDILDTYKWFSVVSIVLLGAGGFLLIKETVARKMGLGIAEIKEKVLKKTEPLVRIQSKLVEIENRMHLVEEMVLQCCELIEVKTTEQKNINCEEKFFAEQHKQDKEVLKEPVKVINTESNSKYSVEECLLQGYNYAAKGEHAKAIWFFEKAIEIAPSSSKAYNNLGVVYSKIGRNEQSIESYHKAIELNPDYAEAYNNLGVVYNKTGRNDQAVEAYCKAIELNPDYSTAYYNLSSTYFVMGKEDQAIELCEKAVQVDNNFSGAYYGLACIYSRKKDKDKTLHNLGLAVKTGFNNINLIEMNADFDFIRKTQEYGSLIKQLAV